MSANDRGAGPGRLLVLALFAAVSSGSFGARILQAHCEIPCGIYADDLRFQRLEEDLVTIEKSMQQINALSKDPAANINQLVRWVDNKERHADHVRHVMVQYFLTQRLKPAKRGDEAARKRYLSMLEQLHLVVVHAMKAKQTTDPAHVGAMRIHLHAFRDLYLGKAGKRHLEQEHGARGGGEVAPGSR